MKVISPRFLLGILLCLLPGLMSAQVLDNSTRVDTLKFAERISLRANALDWLLLTPNIGIEYDLSNKNWNRWTVGVNLRANWQTSHTFKPGVVYNLISAKAEVRNYWRTRQVTDTVEVYEDGIVVDEYVEKGVDPHKTLLGRLFSMRRRKIKHPATTYYRGLYLSHSDYSIKLGKEGKQGKAIGLGLTYGIIRPLYVYKNGNSLDFEAGISAGVAYTKYNTYTHDRESDCYPVVEQKDWHLLKHPVISEIKLGFVYRFGKYPVTKKYRWRYDADADYKFRVDSVATVKEAAKINKMTEKKWEAERKAFVKDSLRNEKQKEVKLDSLKKIEKRREREVKKRMAFVADSLERDSVKSAKILNKKLKDAQKDSLEQAKEQAKEMKKVAKKAAKESKKNKKNKKDESLIGVATDERWFVMGENKMHRDLSCVLREERRLGGYYA